MRKVPHEITLIALGRDGSHVVVRDIVKTSRHYAPHFTRRWVRDPEIHAIVAGKPDDKLDAAQTYVLNR